MKHHGLNNPYVFKMFIFSRLCLKCNEMYCREKGTSFCLDPIERVLHRITDGYYQYEHADGKTKMFLYKLSLKSLRNETRVRLMD